MDTLTVTKVDDVHIQIDCEKGIAKELHDYFKFKVPNARFTPSYRSRMWDGFIRLFNYNNHTMYYGLLPKLDKFARDRHYDVIYDKTIEPAEELSRKEAKEFINTLNMDMVPRDYQISAFVYAVRNRRSLILSPTASGKSLIIYMILKYLNLKSLVIVPTTNLVYQMTSDFENYSKGTVNENHIHRVIAGQDKSSDKQIVISTWQSIYKQPKKYFAQYDVVIGDECHLFKAKSLTSIMTKLVNCKHKHGFTGTLDDTEINKLVLEGLFGPTKKVATTKELIDGDHLSKFRIKSILLHYPEDVKKAVRTKHNKYPDEMKFICGYGKRNKFIYNLVESLEGNTLLLYQFVEKHGEILYNQLKDNIKDRKVFFIHGNVDVQQRENIRAIMETERDAVVVASFGTFSLGTNMLNLHNIIFGSPYKSRIRNLQSIGRVLRKGDNKNRATLYDIADNFSTNTYTNHTLNHYKKRILLYNEEQFPYKIYKVQLK